MTSILWLVFNGRRCFHFQVILTVWPEQGCLKSIQFAGPRSGPPSPPADPPLHKRVWVQPAARPRHSKSCWELLKPGHLYMCKCRQFLCGLLLNIEQQPLLFYMRTNEELTHHHNAHSVLLVDPPAITWLCPDSSTLYLESVNTHQADCNLFLSIIRVS